MLSLEEAEVACNICGINQINYRTKTDFTPGLVQLRHFDGNDYFWDIGGHLLLWERHNKSEPGSQISKTDEEDNAKHLETIPIQELLYSKQETDPLCCGLDPTYLSGAITSEPLQTWQEEGKTLSLFEKRGSTKSDLRWTYPDVCKNCGSDKEHKRLWTRQNRSLLQFLYGAYDRNFWCIGSRVIIKDQPYSNNIGAEEAAINFVREHTKIPVPNWVHSWHEESRALLLMERLPGKPYEDAINEKDEQKNYKLSRKDQDIIAQEIAGYVQQLRVLRSPRAETADGQLLRNFPFWRHVCEAQWQLLPTHEEAKKDWYQKSLSGVDQTDLAELNRLKEIFPKSEPYTFTHGDLSWPNILINEKHVSGIIDWEMSGFAPVWWESIMLSFKAPNMPQLPREGNFLSAWDSIFDSSWTRSLWLHRSYGGGGILRFVEGFFSAAKSVDWKRLQKLQREPIGPPLPPYPPKMKEMQPPRHYMDMNDKWHPREILAPMIRLPEFSANAWCAQ